LLLANILIDDSDPGGAAPLPPLIAENVASFRALHPSLPHRLFRNDDIVALLREKFPAEVLKAYEAMKPYAYKADLAKYCILHEFGGAYADLSYFFANPLPLDEARPIAFREFLRSSPWDVSCGLIFAPPKHKAFECAIELVCANVKRRYYGSTPLCPTGPTLFGKALAVSCEAEELMTGAAVSMPRARLEKPFPDLVLPEYRVTRCLTLEDRLIAIKRKRFGGLAALGITTGNNHPDLWRDRDVYAPA
jgi:hypothetical protein